MIVDIHHYIANFIQFWSDHLHCSEFLQYAYIELEVEP